MEELKKNNTDNAALTQQIEALKQANSEKDNVRNQELANVKKDYEIRLALNSANVRNEIAVRALLDLDKVSFDETGALTGLDEQNVLLSLHASNNMNGKIITKVNRITFDEVINNLNLGSIIYPKFTTMRYILKYVRAMNNSIGSNVETLYKIKNDKAEALEFYVNENSKLVGIPLEKLKLKDNLIICYIKRKGEIITPNGQDCIKKGDYVIVVTTNVGLQDLSDILRS